MSEHLIGPVDSFALKEMRFARDLILPIVDSAKAEPGNPGSILLIELGSDVVAYLFEHVFETTFDVHHQIETAKIWAKEKDYNSFDWLVIERMRLQFESILGVNYERELSKNSSFPDNARRNILVLTTVFIRAACYLDVECLEAIEPKLALSEAPGADSIMDLIVLWASSILRDFSNHSKSIQECQTTINEIIQQRLAQKA